jgi:hypothetical protein
MRKILTVLLLMFCVGLCAQEMDLLYNLRHSSRDANGFVHLRFDGVEEMSDISYEAYYGMNGSWQQTAVNALTFPEMEALIPYEFGQRLRYRLRASVDYAGESLAMLHPAYLDNNVFPVPLSGQALIGNDPVGDSLMVYAPYLDLTDSYIACTQDKIYRTIGNVSGAFPTMQGLTSYNIYLGTLINPDALSDSLIFAMVYSFSIPGVLSSGLYKIGISDGSTPSFERLGDVQSQVTGGKLQLSCNWADLSSDPDFGTWPNSANALLIADLSLQVSIDLSTMTPSLTPGDYGQIGLVEFRDLIYEVAENTLPVLKVDYYNPDTSEIHIYYTDADQDCPLSAVMSADDGSGGVIYTDMTPTYNADGSITYVEYTSGPGVAYTVSDNMMDYVTLDFPVANTDAVQIPAAALSCRLPNPIAANQQVVEIRLSGVGKAPLQMDIYNLRGQKVLSLKGMNPNSESSVYTWDRGQYPALGSGIYFLKISQNGRSGVKRFIITK